MPLPDADLATPSRLILGNFHRLLGRDLVELDDSLRPPAETLFQAAPAVLAALGSFGSDHTFCYLNQTALDLFETTWPDIIGLPSSASAEPVHRDERRLLLDEVGRRGFIDNYSGIRISQRGRRFRILRATVFNLLDDQGSYLGQAATFSDWEFL
jgi:PAS domain-containing protein